MDQYEPIYRPPSEADSLILKVTSGCSHNQCTFCGTYKGRRFYVREWEEIERDVLQAKNSFVHHERAYLSDADALAAGMPMIEQTLKEIRMQLPQIRRVGLHATAFDVLRYSQEELNRLQNLGLGIIYIGAESGNPEILRKIKKGADREELIEAVRRVNRAGILSSVTFISGLGGKEHWREHAIDTANMINDMQPDYASLLTLLIDPNASLSREVENGTFQAMTAEEIMQETRLMLEHITLTKPCIFRSNHASNYFALKGTLPDDKEALIDQIDHAKFLKPDAIRRL